MKFFFSVMIVGLLITLSWPANGADIPYDDFSGPYLDGARWWPREYVREVVDGKLVFKLGNATGMGAEVSPGRFRNRLPIANPGIVHTIEAEVSVKEAILDSASGSMSFARIFGYFYNAHETGGAIGDIWASIMIGDRGNGCLEVFWVVKIITMDDPWTDMVLDSGTLIGPEGGLQYGEIYQLKLSYSLTTQGKGLFSFEADGRAQSFTGPEKKRDSVSLLKELTVGVYADNGYDNGYVHAEFDNVYINNVDYDSFSTPLELSRWEWLEFVRKPVQGELKAGIQRLGSRGGSRTYIAPQDTSYIEARVRLAGDNVFSPGGWGEARIRGHFYNDSFGPGSGLEHNGYEGNVFFKVNVQMDGDGYLKSRAFVSRGNDEDFSAYTVLYNEYFTTPIYLDQEYLLSARFADNQLIFKCNDEILFYKITTPKYQPYGRYRHGLEAKVWLDPGESGYVKAFFDDVRISDKNIVFCLQDYDFDNDMDGQDIVAFISDARGVGLDDFSSHFGRTDCP